MNNILVHKHLIVRAEAKNPPMDETVLTEWFKKFIEEIGMKVMMGPYVKYSHICLLYTSPSPRDRQKSRMPSSA